jgi:large subunit ribosomal protein L10
MLRQQKEKILEDLREKFKNSDTTVFLNYQGLTVKEITQLRRKFKEKDVDFKVVKNRLFKIVAKETLEIDKIEELLNGPTAIAFEKKGVNKAVKTILDFNKEIKPVSIKGAIVEGKILNKEQTESLSKIPDKEILISQFITICQQPIRRLVFALQSPFQKLIYVLDRIKEIKNS